MELILTAISCAQAIEDVVLGQTTFPRHQALYGGRPRRLQHSSE